MSQLVKTLALIRLALALAYLVHCCRSYSWAKMKLIVCSLCPKEHKEKLLLGLATTTSYRGCTIDIIHVHGTVPCIISMAQFRVLHLWLYFRNH